MLTLLKLPIGRSVPLRHAVRHAAMNSRVFRRSLGRQSGGFAAPSRRWLPPLAAAPVDTPQPEESVATSSTDEPITNEQYIDHCQQTYSIPGLVDIAAGPGGLPFVTLQHPNGAQAQICLHGATVTSWQSTTGTESLHLRQGNKFDGQQPIAGGIAVAWPQIGPGALPLHGLLRTLHWSIVEATAYEDAEDPAPCVNFYVDSTSQGTEVWPHSFEAMYSISLEAPEEFQHPRDLAQAAEREIDMLSEDARIAAASAEARRKEEEREAKAAMAAAAAEGASSSFPETVSAPEVVSPPSVLRLRLRVHNSGNDEMKFTTGLLSHLAAEDIRENKKFVKVLGLGGKYALDYAADPMRPQLLIEQGDFVFFDPDSGKNVDKLYVDCDEEGHMLFCPGTQSHVEIRHLEGFTDLEVLHPAAAAPDVARRCVCLGSARKARPVTLKPGDVWSGEVLLTQHNKYWDLPAFEKTDPTTIPVPKREDALPPRRNPLGDEFAYMDELPQ